MKMHFWNKLAIVFLALVFCLSCSKLEKAVSNSAPEIPSDPTPADGAALTSVDINFTWTCADLDGDPITYEIYIDTLANPAIYDSLIDTTSYSSASVHYNLTYYWKVVASDTLGARTESPVWSFSIGDDITSPEVILTSPHGGELWYIGANRGIQWQGTDEDSVDSYWLEYSIDNGLTWANIQDWTEGNPGAFAWTVPDTASAFALVRVSCRDMAGNIGSDVSDASFYVWPEGGMIAFASDSSGYYNIYTMYADGTNRRNISNINASDYSPSWSPDCRKIAFYSYRDGNSQIYVMNSDGTDPVNISNNTDSDSYPFWSPDGTKIAFSSLRDGNYEIYVMNADGTEPINLTNNPYTDYWGSWSPDGSKLTFHSNRDSNYEIYTMDADGSNQTRITIQALDDGYPSYSPDGSLITFTSWRNGNAEIYLMNIDGSIQLNITNSAFQDLLSQWSPDGNKIVFETDRDGNYEIYTLNADGADLVRLTTQAFSDFYPTWSPIY